MVTARVRILSTRAYRPAAFCRKTVGFHDRVAPYAGFPRPSV